tara:strand:- start:585 stop:974 length:390 start_codon:yes stop_codon:yes gene_type:complete
MEIKTIYTINGIERREYPDTLVQETFDLGEHGTTTLNVYRYKHDYKKLYREFELDKPVRLEGYEAPYFEAACYKGIPMRYRWNPTIRNMMMTGNFRIRYRGGSKPGLGYKRLPNHTICEYADTFAIYPK